MGSENWSRALMEVGSGLDKVAGYHAEKERDEANAMREESLARLRMSHNERLAGERNTLTKELAETASTERQTLAKEANQTRITLAGEANEYQDKRLTQQEIARVEATSVAGLKQIDSRIADLQDQMNDARFGAAESMTEADTATLADINGEIASLYKQRKVTAFGDLLRLQKIGDPRYADMSEDEIALAAGFDQDEIDGAKKAMQPESKPEPEPEPSKDLMPVDDKGVDDPGTQASAGQRLLSEPVKNPDGTPKHPVNKDSLGYKAYDWLKNTAVPYGS